MYLYLSSMVSHHVTTCSTAAAKAAKEKPQEDQENIQASTSNIVEQSNELPLLTDEERAVALQAEKERKDHLQMHKDITSVWEKCNKAIFRGAGKMTAGAYAAAVSKIDWELKFQEEGSKTQVTISKCYTIV